MASDAVNTITSQANIFSACFCCYTACDFNDIALGCYHHGDFLCIRCGFCVALGVEPRGIGMVTKENKGEICKVGLFCLDVGIVKPKVLCARFAQCLCCLDVCAIPNVPGYMDEMSFALYCLQCFPEVKCCAKPPGFSAAAEFKSGGTPDPAVPELMSR